MSIDYDEKAEDAVDYEDIDEQYEGPEIQATSEEDLLLPKKDYFSTELSVATLEQKTSVFDDENYDDDEEETEKERDLDTNGEIQNMSSSDLPHDPCMSFRLELIGCNYTRLCSL